MTSSMGFSSFQLTSRGEVRILCDLTPPAQFGLKSALKLNITVGKAAYPTPQVPIPVSPETHIVCQLWDIQAKKLVSEQDATVFYFQADNKLVSGLIDGKGHLHLNGQKGGAFTVKASYNLPTSVFLDLGRYQSRFFVRQDQ